MSKVQIYQPYYLLEKRILEPVDGWIGKQAFFTILGKLGNLAIVVAVVTFVFGEDVRRNNEVFTAWQTITPSYSNGTCRLRTFPEPVSTSL